MNQKFKKILKRTAICATGFVAFAGAVVGGYIVTPNRTKIIDTSVPERQKTLFERFVAKLTKDVGMSEAEEDEVPSFLKATFSGLHANEKFNISYKKDKDSSFVNTIAIDKGEIDFRMSEISMKGIEFNVDLLANYNGKTLPVSVGHFGDDIYFGLKDMKIKFTDFAGENLTDKYWIAFGAYANLDSQVFFKDLGTLISDKVGGLIDGLLSGSTNEAKPNEAKSTEEEGFDFTSLLSAAPKEEERGSSVVFTYGEEKVGGLAINLVANSSDLRLQRVELENLSFGTVTINGAIDVDVVPYDEFISPVTSDYIEVFNYTSLMGKVLTLLNEDNQKFGLEFSMDLDQIDKEAKYDIAKVNGSINVDFDKLLDLSKYQAVGETTVSEDYKVVGELSDLGFNLQLDLLGKDDHEYANLDFAFANGEGYLRFNEQEDINGDKDAVLRLYFDTETTNWIMNKIPELIDSLSEDENTDAMETLSKFLSDDLIDSINNYDFSFVLDMLETLSNGPDGFKLGINLSSLGLGNDSCIDLNIKNDVDYFSDYFELDRTIRELADKGNNRTPEEDALLAQAVALYEEKMAQINNSGMTLDVKNIAFGNFKLNANLHTAPYAGVELGETALYQSTRFIPDVVEQVSNLAQSKKTGFRISGDMKDDAGLGISFDGKGCLDNNDEVKEGFGNMTINQYKYHANQVWATHDMAVNVTNLASNVIVTKDPETGKVISRNNQNEALFVYGDPTSSDSIKGKMHLQTFTDIFDLISTFIKEEGNNPKYTKFLAPITKVLGMSTLGDIIENKDYLYVASNSVLKKVDITTDVSGTQIKIVLNKNMFGLELPEDLAIYINTKYVENKQELSSLEIKNMRLSSKENASKLNLKFELQDYLNGTVDHINKQDSFMNLDGIKTLLDLGINTTKVNYYHLSANATVSLKIAGFSSSFIKLPLKGINFYIYVDGVKVKVYGKIDEVPTFIGVTQDDLFGTKDMSSEFTFETFEDSDDKVGGTFNIKRYFHKDTTERGERISWWQYETLYFHENDVYYYRSDSGTFMDNIAQYLLTGLIGVKSSLYLSALNEESGEIEEKPAGNFLNTFTDTGFSCTEDANGNSTIKLGLNLNELTGISALKELEATITSKHISYDGSSKGLDILSTLTASLRVNFAKVFDINVDFSASVEDAVVPQAEAKASWDYFSVKHENEDRFINFAGVNSVVVPASNVNNPDNPYTYTEKIQYYK